MKRVTNKTPGLINQNSFGMNTKQMLLTARSPSLCVCVCVQVSKSILKSNWLPPARVDNKMGENITPNAASRMSVWRYTYSLQHIHVHDLLA